MRRLVATLALLAAACSSGASQPPAAIAGDARAPRVIELFQSQGCSSCPPANVNLNRIADRADVLALSFAVTYWDALGWKDRFAAPAFTQRQWDYARAAGRQQVATPQMIFNGTRAAVGGNPAEFDKLVAATPPLTGGPRIDLDHGTLVIGAGRPGPPATIWLVRYDPRVRQVAISAGENGGRTLPHRDIVTALTDAGQWTGREVRLPIPPAADGAFKTAILLQRGRGGPLVAARKL